MTPIEDEPIYGEAFPKEKRIKIEVFVPDATMKDLTKVICEELLHVKHPEILEHAINALPKISFIHLSPFGQASKVHLFDMFMTQQAWCAP